MVRVGILLAFNGQIAAYGRYDRIAGYLGADHIQVFACGNSNAVYTDDLGRRMSRQYICALVLAFRCAGIDRQQSALSRTEGLSFTDPIPAIIS